MQLLKSSVLTLLGFLLLAIGLLFILLPGPAIIFIPLGLGLLSLKYQWAKRWLKVSQRWMRQNAQKIDSFILRRKHKR